MPQLADERACSSTAGRLSAGEEARSRGSAAVFPVSDGRFSAADLLPKLRRVRETRASDHALQKGFSGALREVQLPIVLRHCALILGFAAVAPLIAGEVKRVWPARPSPLHGIRAAGDLWCNRCARAQTDLPGFRTSARPNMGRRKLVRRRNRKTETGWRVRGGKAFCRRRGIACGEAGTGNPNAKRESEPNEAAGRGGLTRNVCVMWAYGKRRLVQ